MGDCDVPAGFVVEESNAVEGFYGFCKLGRRHCASEAGGEYIYVACLGRAKLTS